MLAVFFKTGPFAWNGILGFWSPVIVFAIGMSITCWLMYPRARYEARTAAPAAQREPMTATSPSSEPTSRRMDKR
jgi:hypothetical protein